MTTLHLILPRRFTRQPSGQVVIDWNNPLTKELDGLIDGLTRRELVRRGPVTATGVAHKASQSGLGTYNNTLASTSNGVFAPASSIATGVATQAVFLGGFVDLGTQSYEYAAGNYNGTGSGIAAIHTNIGRRWGVYDAPGLIDSGEALTQGGNYLLAHTRDGSNHRLYNNGRLKATAAGSRASMSNAAYAMCTLGSAGIAWTCYTPIFWTARWRRVLPESELKCLSANPWQLFKVKRRVLYFDAGTAAAALDGAATATATASGTLTTQIPLTGAAAVIGTASGALSTAIPLSGQAAAVSLADGVLTTQITLSGAALAQALAAAGLTTGIPLAGQAAGQATATGDLSTGSSLSGAAAAEALAQASLTTQIRLSGAALAEALAGGDLTAPGAGLSGAATAQAGASGALYTAIPLAGAAQAYSTASGGLTTIIPLAGAAASVSTATGDLTIESTLTGAALATALAGGDLTTVIRLEGAAVARAGASGSLGVALAVPAHLPHLVEAANGAWEVEAYSSTWEVAA